MTYPQRSTGSGATVVRWDGPLMVLPGNLARMAALLGTR